MNCDDTDSRGAYNLRGVRDTSFGSRQGGTVTLALHTAAILPSLPKMDRLPTLSLSLSLCRTGGLSLARRMRCSGMSGLLGPAGKRAPPEGDARLGEKLVDRSALDPSD